MGDRITAEYFARANLATRGEFGVARRVDSDDVLAWRACYDDGREVFLTDDGMSRGGWVPVVESGRLSLARLEAAWEAAEQAGECREGDVLIIRDDEDNYLVRRMCDRSYLDSTARILSRSPREPWADLADVLVAESVVFDSEDASIAARALHSAGVRVMGGDDDE